MTGGILPSNHPGIAPGTNHLFIFLGKLNLGWWPHIPLPTPLRHNSIGIGTMFDTLEEHLFFFYCLAMLTQSLGCIWNICKQHLCWLSSGYLWTSTYVPLFLWNFKSSSLVTLFNYFVVEEPFLFKFKILKTYSGMPIMLWHIWILYMLVVYFYSSWKS